MERPAATPDEWMIPLFGQEQPDGKRNVVEGRSIWLGHAYSPTPQPAVRMTRADLERWRPALLPPDATELATADIDPSPAGFDAWEAWVAQRWPTSLPGHGSARDLLD